ncbi:MAG TPA: hypothetical protein VK934_01320 [Fimbriimonas sp.]|nr:hypothetical protein [Fimbriimonas sp.]
MSEAENTTPVAKAEVSFGDKLQSLPKPWLYLILILITSLPQFFPVPLPNKPNKASEDLFHLLTTIPVDKPVLIGSDWTNSTRGESGGEFKSLVRILMRRNIKFAVYGFDPQAPQVVKDVIRNLNAEAKANGQKEYLVWNDWVSIGYFPNAEGTVNAINNNVRSAFADKKSPDDSGKMQPVMSSPVLKNVKSVSDFSCLIVATASNTSNVTIERITKVPLAMMVTGVMGPETQVYYDSGQLKGLAIGLKGCYDLETLMASYKDPATGADWSGKQYVNMDNGAKYYPTLHLALLLMIGAVVAGNVGMLLTRKKGGPRA